MTMLSFLVTPYNLYNWVSFPCNDLKTPIPHCDLRFNSLSSSYLGILEFHFTVQILVVLAGLCVLKIASFFLYLCFYSHSPTTQTVFPYTALPGYPSPAPLLKSCLFSLLSYFSGYFKNTYFLWNRVLHPEVLKSSCRIFTLNTRIYRGSTLLIV